MLHAVHEVRSRRLGELACLTRPQCRCVGPVNTVRGLHTDAGLVHELAAEIGRVGEETNPRSAHTKVECARLLPSGAPQRMQAATIVATKFRL